MIKYYVDFILSTKYVKRLSMKMILEIREKKQYVDKK